MTTIARLPGAKLPDLHYELVAEVWREAAEETDETSLAVAQTWGVPLSTANGWIKRARARGFLEPREPRCSGRCGKCCPVVTNQ